MTKGGNSSARKGAEWGSWGAAGALSCELDADHTDVFGLRKLTELRRHASLCIMKSLKIG